MSKMQNRLFRQTKRNQREKEMKSGVYILCFPITNEIYIGSSVRGIHTRMLQHRKLLQHRQHPNKKMQRAWYKNEKYFLFLPLEYCEGVKTIEREDFWIKKLKPELNNTHYAYNRLFGNAYQSPEEIEYVENMLREYWANTKCKRGVHLALDKRAHQKPQKEK